MRASYRISCSHLMLFVAVYLHQTQKSLLVGLFPTYICVHNVVEAHCHVAKSTSRD